MGFMDRYKKTETSRAEDICRYFATLFPDREEMVYPEEVTDSVSVDVHIMMPNENQNFYVVYTVGMSDLPMTLPDKFSGQLHKSHLRSHTHRIPKPSAFVQFPFSADKEIEPFSDSSDKNEDFLC